MNAHRSPRISLWAPTGLAALFIGSGVLHLIRPKIYLPAVPRALPAHDAIVLMSGVAELACAAGLVAGARWAGPASAALLVAVFPANVSFALTTTADPASSRVLVAAVWLRLPLQAPLIWAAFQARPPRTGPARGTA